MKYMNVHWTTPPLLPLTPKNFFEDEEFFSLADGQLGGAGYSLPPLEGRSGFFPRSA